MKKILTPDARENFLDVLRETCNVTAAARAVGVVRQAAYDVYEREPDFAKLWDEALKEGIELLEEKARQRAFDGVDKPVFYKGRECGHETEYSDQLTMFLLRAHAPARFREKSSVELTGANGGPIEMTDTDTASKLAKLLAAAQARKSAEDDEPLA